MRTKKKKIILKAQLNLVSIRSVEKKKLLCLMIKMNLLNFEFEFFNIIFNKFDYFTVCRKCYSFKLNAEFCEFWKFQTCTF